MARWVNTPLPSYNPFSLRLSHTVLIYTYIWICESHLFFRLSHLILLPYHPTRYPYLITLPVSLLVHPTLSPVPVPPTSCSPYIVHNSPNTMSNTIMVVRRRCSFITHLLQMNSSRPSYVCSPYSF